jgi:hypothetical protein
MDKNREQKEDSHSKITCKDFEKSSASFYPGEVLLKERLLVVSRLNGGASPRSANRLVSSWKWDAARYLT